MLWLTLIHVINGGPSQLTLLVRLHVSGDCDLGIFSHDEVIKWKHFPRYWPFVRGIHRSPVNSPQKGQWRGALMFSLICAWINDWVNNREAGDLRRHRAHYDVTVMIEVSVAIKTLRPKQDGRHFPDDILQMHFLEWKYINFDWDFTSLFPRVKSTTFQHWFRQWLGTGQATSH